MIGTRHEKIVIVLTSYIIGFTTAFIAFGISTMDESAQYALRESEPEAISFKEIHHNISEIGTNDEGLFVNVGGYERIISSYTSQLPASVIGSTSLAGYPVKHHTPLVSQDGWSAFYCEQEFEDAKTCVPYVFNLYDDTVYKVTLDDTAQPLDINNYTVAWSEDNTLLLNGFSSVSNQTPWIFITEGEDENGTDTTAVEDVIELEALEGNGETATDEAQITDLLSDTEPILQ